MEKRWVFCIVMEYAEQGDLLNSIEMHQRNKILISEDKIWKYAMQISEGLSYLH